MSPQNSLKDRIEGLVDDMYSTGILYAEAVREFKRSFLLRVLAERKGNQFKAALDLEMHRNTLSRTIHELDLGQQVAELRGKH